MSASYITAGVERYGRVAATHGIEPRHRFLAKRVIRLHAWMPIHLRRRDSREKWLLRRAIEPLVPGDTAWADRRAHLGGRFNTIGARWLQDWPAAQMETQLGYRVDVQKCNQFVEEFSRSGSVYGFNVLYLSMLTAEWSRQRHPGVSYAPVDPRPTKVAS